MKTLQLRLTNLSENMKVHVDKKQIYIDAWIAKKFLVLLKRKLTRGQIPRKRGFRELMAAVFPDHFGGGDSDGDHPSQACWHLAKKSKQQKGSILFLVLFWGKMHQKKCRSHMYFFWPRLHAIAQNLPG